MTMQPGVRESITGLTDEALLEYIQVGTTMYETDAVEFARQVMAGRGIVPERRKELERIIEERRAAETARKAEVGNRPLGRVGRTFALIGGVCTVLPFSMVYLIAWIHLRHRGEHRKLRDLRTFSLMGLASLLPLLILLPFIIRAILWITGNV